MEIKTCEQYVLSLLEENQDKIFHLQETVKNLRMELIKREKKIRKLELDLFHIRSDYKEYKKALDKWEEINGKIEDPQIVPYEIQGICPLGENDEK